MYVILNVRVPPEESESEVSGVTAYVYPDLLPIFPIVYPPVGWLVYVLPEDKELCVKVAGPGIGQVGGAGGSSE